MNTKEGKGIPISTHSSIFREHRPGYKPDIWELDLVHLSVKEGCPLRQVMVTFSLSETPGTMTEGYTVDNLIRVGVAAAILLIVGGFLVEAWHSERLSPNKPW